MFFYSRKAGGSGLIPYIIKLRVPPVPKSE